MGDVGKELVDSMCTKWSPFEYAETAKAFRKDLIEFGLTCVAEAEKARIQKAARGSDRLTCGGKRPPFVVAQWPHYGFGNNPEHDTVSEARVVVTDFGVVVLELGHKDALGGISWRPLAPGKLLGGPWKDTAVSSHEAAACGDYFEKLAADAMRVNEEPDAETKDQQQ